MIFVRLHELAQLSGCNTHKYLVDIKFNQMFGWWPYMSWFRNPSSVHLEKLQSSRIYGPNLEGTFVMPTQIPLPRTHPKAIFNCKGGWQKHSCWMTRRHRKWISHSEKFSELEQCHTSHWVSETLFLCCKESTLKKGGICHWLYINFTLPPKSS